MPTGKTRSLLIAAASLALLAPMSPAVAVTSGTTDGTSISSPTAPAPPSSQMGALSAGPDALGYWTPEKMRNAIPADKPVKALPPKNIPMPVGPTPLGNNPGTMGTQADGSTAAGPAPAGAPEIGSRPVLPTYTDPAGQIGTSAVAVPNTVGRLFYIGPDGKNYVCTAATVNSNAKNLIMTAGHCVYTYGAGWHSSIVFAPAYWDGTAPYGLWNWSTARTFSSWIHNQDYSHDQAFVSVYPRGGTPIVRALGGNGFYINSDTSQSSARIWGYPAGGKYAGNMRPWYCDGSTYDSSFWDSDSKMDCDMTGGSSGGPWLKDRIDDNLGYIFAVTSRRTLTGTTSLIATPNTGDVLTMFNAMG